MFYNIKFFYRAFENRGAPGGAGRRVTGRKRLTFTSKIVRNSRKFVSINRNRSTVKYRKRPRSLVNSPPSGETITVADGVRTGPFVGFLIEREKRIVGVRDPSVSGDSERNKYSSTRYYQRRRTRRLKSREVTQPRARVPIAVT